jgi:ankyrin repeat protein
MTDTTAAVAIHGWLEPFLAHACQHALLRLPLLYRCSGANWRWREAVRYALPTLRTLDFRGHEARVTGPHVLEVLARVAGANLGVINLSNCLLLGAADVEQILTRVTATCTGVVEIDVTCMSSRNVLRAVAVRARDALAAASPRDLYEFLEALFRAGEEEGEEESAGGRCSFGRVCSHLRTLPVPHLVLDPEFDPEENSLPGDSDNEPEPEEENAGDYDSDSEEEDERKLTYFDRLLLKEARDGGGWSAALLLGVSFGKDYPEGARMCDCDAYAWVPRSARGGEMMRGSLTRSRVLHEAAKRGDADMVSLLLRARADVDVVDGKENSPLLLACKGGHLEIAKMLVVNGADASAAPPSWSPGDSSWTEDSGDTLLLAACRAGNLALVEFLVVKGAYASSTIAQGDTPLLAACQAGSLEIAEFLVVKGADVSAANKLGDTPLLAACQVGNLALATMLLDKGANASAVNTIGDTPMRAAVASGSAELARELVARGANVTSREDGANVLTLAILSQNEACIKFALAQGPKRLPDQDTLDVRDFVQRLAQAFGDRAQIGAWIRDGAAPRDLMGEIGALLSSADVGATVKNRLEDVLAFLNQYEALLSDPSCWPVPRAEQLVAQLASQEPYAIFAPVESGAWSAAGISTDIIEWKNKPHQELLQCRRTHKARGKVNAMAVSPDGSRVAYATGQTVVVLNFQTGLVVFQLRAGWGEWCEVSPSPKEYLCVCVCVCVCVCRVCYMYTYILSPSLSWLYCVCVCVCYMYTDILSPSLS